MNVVNQEEFLNTKLVKKKWLELRFLLNYRNHKTERAELEKYKKKNKKIKKENNYSNLFTPIKSFLEMCDLPSENDINFSEKVEEFLWSTWLKNSKKGIEYLLYLHFIV